MTDCIFWLTRSQEFLESIKRAWERVFTVHKRAAIGARGFRTSTRVKLCGAGSVGQDNLTKPDIEKRIAK